MSIAGVSLSKISAKAFDNLQLLYRRKRGNTTSERLIVWSFVALQLTVYTCVSHSSQSLLVFSPTARWEGRERPCLGDCWFLRVCRGQASPSAQVWTMDWQRFSAGLGWLLPHCRLKFLGAFNSHTQCWELLRQPAELWIVASKLFLHVAYPFGPLPSPLYHVPGNTGLWHGVLTEPGFCFISLVSVTY